MRCLNDMLFKAPEHSRFGKKSRFVEGIPHLSKYRPQHRALRFRQAGLAAEPYHVPVGLPAFELPRIDHSAPFSPQEMRAEDVRANLWTRPVDQLPALGKAPAAAVHSTGLRQWTPALRIARNRSFVAASSLGKLPRALMILRNDRCRLSSAYERFVAAWLPRPPREGVRGRLKPARPE